MLGNSGVCLPQTLLISLQRHDGISTLNHPGFIPPCPLKREHHYHTGQPTVVIFLIRIVGELATAIPPHPGRLPPSELVLTRICLRYPYRAFSTIDHYQDAARDSRPRDTGTICKGNTHQPSGQPKKYESRDMSDLIHPQVVYQDYHAWSLIIGLGGDDK